MSPDDFLVVLSLMLAPFSVVSAGILVHAAVQPPRIGALTERAVLAATIMVMVLSGAIITINRVSGYSLFPVEVARVLFLGSLVVLEFVPVGWFALFLSHRLGGTFPKDEEERAIAMLRSRGFRVTPPEVDL